MPPPETFYRFTPHRGPASIFSHRFGAAPAGSVTPAISVTRVGIVRAASTPPRPPRASDDGHVLMNAARILHDEQRKMIRRGAALGTASASTAPARSTTTCCAGSAAPSRRAYRSIPFLGIPALALVAWSGQDRNYFDAARDIDFEISAATHAGRFRLHHDIADTPIGRRRQVTCLKISRACNFFFLRKGRYITSMKRKGENTTRGRELLLRVF